MADKAHGDKMKQPKAQVGHRAGPLKQQNKSHKHGKHRSKGALDAINKGRTDVKNETKRKKKELSRKEKRKQASQMRTKKREEVLAQKRGMGGQGNPPILITIIATSPLVETNDFLSLIESCDEEATVTYSPSGCVHISVPRYKQRFCFVSPDMNDLNSVLDAAKVADTLLFLYPLIPEEDVQESLVMTALYAQGLPSSIHVALGDATFLGKNMIICKKNLTKIIQSRFPDEKPHFVSRASECLLVLRQIGNQKQRRVYYRDRRAHVFSEGEVRFEPNENSDAQGTVFVTGYIRSKPLSVDGLVHVTGWGDFQLKQIDRLSDQHPLNCVQRSRKNSLSMEMDVSEGDVCTTIKADPNMQESLQSENVADPLDAEQTWPTEEEMKEAEETADDFHAVKKTVRKVPKGTSEYQAAWIVDSEGEEDDDDDDDDDIDMDFNQFQPKDGDKSDEESVENEDFETVTVTEADEGVRYDDKFDVDEDVSALKKFRTRCDDDENPDEVDLDCDVLARVRFQKFRGLKSFRTSPWDPKENLPLDYARIFQFQNFAATKKRVAQEETVGAMPGWFVTLQIANVPRNIYERHSNGRPLTVFQLLPHEQKMSVLNIVVKRNPLCDVDVFSKEDLIFHIGFRRFSAQPIFSQHTNGTRQKYERFIRDDYAVATIYAPIVFPPMPVLVFKKSSGGLLDLVGTGGVLSVNPDRVVLKRVILTANPFRINKRSAVVRFMFFNTEDIDWFKPVELRTTLGRRGHIRESLGTHGHMKCLFNDQLRSNERVQMHLYKRVFPKWSYNPIVD